MCMLGHTMSHKITSYSKQMFLASLMVLNILTSVYYVPKSAKQFCQFIAGIFPSLSEFMFWLFPAICCLVFFVYMSGILAVMLLPMYMFSKKTLSIMEYSVRGLNKKQFGKVCVIAALVSIMIWVFQSSYRQRMNMTKDEQYALSCYTWTFMMFVPVVIVLW